MTNGVVNRSRRVPLYQQIKEDLLDQIAAGVWQPGDRIPPETELQRRYGVSRITMIKALSELVQEGHLYRLQGRGTFVSKPRIEKHLLRLTSFTQETIERGMRPSSRLVELRQISAPREVAAKLRIAPGDPVWVVRRIREGDSEPIALQSSHLPVRMVPVLEPKDFDAHASLYHLLKERYQLVPARAAEEYRAVAIERRETATLLGVQIGSPALYAERVAYLPDGSPMEFVVSVLRADRYALHVELSDFNTENQHHG